MIKLNDLFSESISVNGLDYLLDKYREYTNWTDWYISGGCYTFAYALYQYLGKRGKLIAVGESGTGVMVHVCILYQGKYCDYNGCRSKKDILSDIAVFGSVDWFEVNENDIKVEHNFDKSEANKIINTFNKLK